MKKFQMKKMAVAIALGLSAATSTQVMAQASSFEEAKQHVAAGKRVVEVGFSTEKTSPLKGFATNLPLVEVLKQITPNGWVVKKNDTADNRIDINKAVSWTGGSAWNITLENVVTQANTNAVIDWTKKEVTLIALSKPVKTTTVKTVTTKDEITTVKAKENEAVSVFELEGNDPKTVEIVSGESNYKNIPVVNNNQVEEKVETTFEEKQQLAQQEWHLDSSKSLKENVKSWGEQAGYKVEWLGEDYPVDRSMMIYGEFDGEEGPIRQLSEDYGPDSRLQKPLSFVFYQNKVLVVEDLKYEQQGFPQFGQ